MTQWLLLQKKKKKRIAECRAAPPRPPPPVPHPTTPPDPAPTKKGSAGLSESVWCGREDNSRFRRADLLLLRKTEEGRPVVERSNVLGLQEVPFPLPRDILTITGV
ncbi:unnamed protein product [Arctogadus glacialis]